MKISVIIPVYNSEKYIIDCLISIANQTYGSFECLCVDDGSTDASADLIEEFARKDSRFRLIRQKNTKQAGARNNGLRQASGELISFVDSDDYIHPRMLEILAEVMKEQGADVAGCLFKKTSEPSPHEFPEISSFPTHVYEDALKGFVCEREVATAVWGRLYKRSVIEGIFFTEGIYFEDVPWTVEVMDKVNRFILVQKPLYYYFNNNASTMRTKWSNEKTDHYIRVINVVYDYIVQSRPEMLGLVKRRILNGHVKMLFNRIKKLSAEECAESWGYAQRILKKLYADGRISYDGLKLKHKWRLWKLLHGKTLSSRPES